MHKGCVGFFACLALILGVTGEITVSESETKKVGVDGFRQFWGMCGLSEEEYRTDKRNPGKRSESSAGKGKKNLSGEKSQRKSFVCKKGNAFPGRSGSRRK